MKKNLPALLLLISFSINVSFLEGQNLAIGQWRDHLPYHQTKAIAEAPDKIYAATPYSVFSFNKSDQSIERISKSSGLSDVIVSSVKYHSSGNLAIAYSNGNIDLFNDGSIYNINDIKRSLITAGKNINRITIINELAYLSCGYGISVLDVSKKEIKETWFIGENGTYINVNDLTSDGSRFFAATDQGVYSANMNDPNLSNYNSWKKEDLPPGSYSHAEFFNGRLYIAFNGSGYETDRLIMLNQGKWKYIDQLGALDIISLEASGNKIVVTGNWNVAVYDTDWNVVEIINSYQTQRSIEPKFAMIGEDQIMWIADNVQGLVKHSGPASNERIVPNSAAGIYSYAMDIKNGKLWVANGMRSKSNGNNRFLYIGMMNFENETWSAINRETTPGGDTIYDVVAAAIDPSDSRRAYLGAIGQGVWEVYDGKIVTNYDENNSSLTQFASGWYHLGVSGLDFDQENNLWVVNTRVANGLSVKTAAGDWQSFSIPELSYQQYIGNILVSQSGHKWIELPNQGIVVFDDNGTISKTSDDRSKLLNSGSGNGALHNLAVRCMAEDRDGKIWVGTEEGIAVFYSPSSVFSGGNFDAQQILVTQGGYTGYLLESEAVGAMAIDGANRKWVGTDGAGVFLLSADGTEQLLHFTEENSPLLSNFIWCIGINDKTGEVFFGTENGICSYKSDATGGLEDFNDVYAYPNPVRSGYTGPIAIKNLVTDANVKITDTGGSLVYETTALGGQAIWNGQDYNGNRVKSGVYLAFCSNKDGTKSIVTKILFLN